jgi:hypothetical protein
MCEENLQGWVRRSSNENDDDLNKAAKATLGPRENQLLFKGEPYTLRLRQLRDQVMVPRGAAFNGMIEFSLCLFALGAKFRREKRSWLASPSCRSPSCTGRDVLRRP